MCLAPGILQFGRSRSPQEEAARRPVTESHTLGQAAAEGPKVRRVLQRKQREVGASRASREEDPSAVAERRFRSDSGRSEAEQHNCEAVPRGPEHGEGVRERLPVFRHLPGRRQ